MLLRNLQVPAWGTVRQVHSALQRQWQNNINLAGTLLGNNMYRLAYDNVVGLCKSHG